VDLRKEPRHSAPLEIKTVSGNGDHEKVINVSQNGCSFRSPANFSKRDTIFLRINTRNRTLEYDLVFAVTGEVVWKRRRSAERNVYGVSILGFEEGGFPVWKRVLKKMNGNGGLV
jgi:hypothetical protein